MDPVRRKLLWEQIRTLGESGCGVLLVTHNVTEAERAVQHLAVLDEGRVVTHGTPAELRGRASGHLRLELVAHHREGARRAADRFADLAASTIAGRRALLGLREEDLSTAIGRASEQRAEGRIEEFSLTPVGLEDVYVDLVGPDTQDLDPHDLDTETPASRGLDTDGHGTRRARNDDEEGGDDVGRSDDADEPGTTDTSGVVA